MKGKLRIGMIGCGMISEFHLRAWSRIESVEVIALADIVAESAERQRDRFAPLARIYDDAREMLDEEQLDFVDILTPPATHLGLCQQAFGAGLHVVCQKPLSDRIENAREMVEISSRAERILSVHENHRYRPWFQEILRRASEGFFGKIRYARFCQFDPQEPAEAYKCQSNRGVMLEYGSHLIDLLFALLGPPKQTWGRFQRLNPSVRGESLVNLILDCGDANVQIDTAWKAGGLARGEVVVVGEKGEAIYEGSMTRAAESRFRLIQHDGTILDERRSPIDDYVESFYLFQSAFVAAMRGDGHVPQPAAENLRVVEATFDAYRAIGLP